jgi:hypothetical protein
MATNTYVALDKITVSGSSTNTVTLSAIPQTYKDLVIVCSGTQAALTDMAIRFNGDTAGNYSKTLFSGNGSTPVTAPYTNASQIFVTYQSTTQANTIIHIMNYADTSVQKTVLAQGSATGTAVQLNSGAWRKSPLEAINSVTIFPFGGTNFSDGYTVSLYGIAAEGVNPAAKATGGIITSDSTYYYHTFTSTGVFTPNGSLTADVLVVAGGGGGASSKNGSGQGGMGPGGAGGLLAFTSQSLTGIGYTCTVGGGGAGGNSTAGANGGNSQFGGLTACVGGGAGGCENPNINPAVGGSGGGGAFIHATGAAGTSGQGNAGGGGGPATGFGVAGGGGGGAGGIGAVGTTVSPNSIGGAGGIGATSSLINAMGAATGTGQLSGGNYYYAGGGGGSAIVGGAGGLGGGGFGSSGLTGSAGNGTANTGGGGGSTGGNSGAPTAASGGSGVVIVRYLKA